MSADGLDPRGSPRIGDSLGLGVGWRKVCRKRIILVVESDEPGAGPQQAIDLAVDVVVVEADGRKSNSLMDVDTLN